MSVRTMARLHRTPTEHTDWCARDHQCGLDQHRSTPVVTATAGGRAVLTRVHAGGDYAEVTIRIPLSTHDGTARCQLGTVVRLLRDLLTAVSAAGRPAALTGHRTPQALSSNAGHHDALSGALPLYRLDQRRAA